MKQTTRCMLCNRIGHHSHECRSAPNKVTKSKFCGKPGHKSDSCWNVKAQKEQGSACAYEATANACHASSCEKIVELRESMRSDVTYADSIFLVKGMPVVEGQVFGRKVKVLRDTGSNTAIVRGDLIPDHCLTRKRIRAVLTDGSWKDVSEARISVCTPYFTGELKALCMDEPLYDLVLGNNPGVRGPNDPDTNWRRAVVDGSDVTAANSSIQVTSRYASAIIKSKEEKVILLHDTEIKIGDLTKGQLVEE